MTRLFLALCLLLAPTATFAADSKGDFAIRGLGRFACPQLLEAMEAKDARLNVFGAWVDGYISALNQQSPGTFDAAPWQTTELIVSLAGRRCAAEADANFHTIVGRILAEMRPLRLVERSDVVALRSGERVSPLYAEIVNRAKLRLTELGHRGADDDDQMLGASIRAFQADKNLPQTGLLDQQTLLNLFVRPKP